MSIKVGDCVELGEKTPGKRDGSFLRITDILYTRSTGKVTLRGFVFARTRELGGLISFKLNEVCLLAPDVNPEKSDLQRILKHAVQSLDLATEVYFDSGEPVLRRLIITNQPFPCFSLHEGLEWDADDPNAPELKTLLSRTAQLVCRYVLISYQQDKPVENDRLPLAGDIRNVPADMADTTYAIPDWQLLRDCRGPAGQHGDYTFADGFCGAGGVSAGAAAAGLYAKFAFDYDQHACQTYGVNRPQALVYHSDVNDFLALVDEQEDEFRADVLHLSPPCQAYSTQNALAGTRDPDSDGGRRDDANQAASFGIRELLQHCKPRVATIEQTSGIFGPRSIGFFRGVIRQFTDVGYSICWRLVDLAYYGCPQHRKRVIVIASCPGSALPAFPKPTHGPGTGKQFRTINDYICNITPDHKDHNPGTPDPTMSYSGNTLLTGLIATGGTTNRHPSGRSFTIRELAALMTLPLDFGFAPGLTDTIMKKQIGNMVPACFAETLMRAILGALYIEDQQFVTSMRLAGELGDVEDKPIVIDDDDDDDDIDDARSDATIG